MTGRESRRPLEDMLSDLVAGFTVPPRDSRTGLHATSVELALPVETRVASGPNGLTVHADMPATRTPTAFDLPVGRLTLRLTTFPTGAAP